MEEVEFILNVCKLLLKYYISISSSYSWVLLQMVQLIKDPKGETVMDHSTTKDKSTYHGGSQAVPNVILQEEVAQLKQSFRIGKGARRG